MMAAQSAAAGLAPRRTASTSTALETGQDRHGNRILTWINDRGDPASAAAVFCSGLPAHHGRVVTASAQIDSWKRKHPPIERRLQREHLERLWA